MPLKYIKIPFVYPDKKDRILGSDGNIEYIHNFEEAKKKCIEEETCVGLYDYRCDGTGFTRFTSLDSLIHTGDKAITHNKEMTCVWIKQDDELLSKNGYEYKNKGNKGCINKRKITWKKHLEKGCKTYKRNNKSNKGPEYISWSIASMKKKCNETEGCTGLHRWSGCGGGFARCTSEYTGEESLNDNKPGCALMKILGNDYVSEKSEAKEECSKDRACTGFIKDDNGYSICYGGITDDDDFTYFEKTENKVKKGGSCKKDTDCSSGACRGRFCCVKGWEVNCKACHPKTTQWPGKCNVCNKTSTYEYQKDSNQNYKCLTKIDYKERGESCEKDSDCISKKCLNKVCCKLPVDQKCGACNHKDTNPINPGTCSSCNKGKFMHDGSCGTRKQFGKTCNSNNDCTSKVCKGKCCKAFIKRCKTCGTNGMCAQCETGYTKYDIGYCMSNEKYKALQVKRKRLDEAVAKALRDRWKKDLEAKKKAAAKRKRELDKQAREVVEKARQEAEKKKLEAGQEAEKKKLEAEQEAERKRLEAEKEAERKRLEADKEAERKRVEVEREAERKRVEAEREAERKRVEAEKENLRIKENARREAERRRREAERIKNEKEKQDTLDKIKESERIEKEQAEKIKKELEKKAEDKKKKDQEKIKEQEKKEKEKISRNNKEKKEQINKKVKDDKEKINNEEKEKKDNINATKKNKKKKIDKKADDDIKKNKQQADKENKKNDDDIKKTKEKITEKKEEQVVINRILEKAKEDTMKKIIMYSLIGIGVIIFLVFILGKRKGYDRGISNEAESIEEGYAF